MKNVKKKIRAQSSEKRRWCRKCGMQNKGNRAMKRRARKVCLGNFFGPLHWYPYLPH